MKVIKQTLTAGIEEVCRQAHMSTSDIDFAFQRLLGYGENVDDAVSIDVDAKHIIEMAGIDTVLLTPWTKHGERT